MVTLGLNIALRISDILDLKWRDMYEFEQRAYRNHVSILKKDTKVQYVSTKQKCDRSPRYAKKFSYLYNTRLLYCEK